MSDSALPPGWEWATLGEVARLSSGGTPLRAHPEYYGHGLPWLKIGDLNDRLVYEAAEQITPQGLEHSTARRLAPGALLVAMYGSIGKLGVLGMEAATNQAICAVEPVEGVSTWYVFWWLLSQRQTLLDAGRGGTQANINQEILRRFPIPVSPRAEQDRIVAAIEVALSNMDIAASVVRRAITLGRLFDDAVIENLVWHGPAEPVGSADLDETQLRTSRREAIKAQRVAAGRKIGQLKDPLPPVELDRVLPSKWRLMSLDQACSLVTDGDHNPPKRQQHGVPHLTARNIRDFAIDPAGATRISEADFDRVRLRYNPLPGDVIVTCVGTIGRVAVVPPDLIFSPDRNLAAARPIPEVVSEFLMFVLATPTLQSMMRGASGSTAQPHLYLGDMKRLPIPVPPTEVQVRIVKDIQSSRYRGAELSKSLRDTLNMDTAMRHSILRDAFAGRLIQQDPTDESASALLDRIRVERSIAASGEPRKRRSARPA